MRHALGLWCCTPTQGASTMATKSSIPVGGLRLSRREFLGLGGGAVAGLVLVSCGATQTQAPTAVPAAPTAAPARQRRPPPTAAAAAPTEWPGGRVIKATLVDQESATITRTGRTIVADVVAREKGWLKEVGIESRRGHHLRRRAYRDRRRRCRLDGRRHRCGPSRHMSIKGSMSGGWAHAATARICCLAWPLV